MMDTKLAMKLYRIMEKTEALEKSLTVGEGTKGEYKAVGEASVLNMLKPLFKEEKLLILPVEGEISEHVDRTISYSKEGTRAVTQLKVYFDIVDAETGETTRIIGFGNGADSQDKGSGKAFTYAFKTALMKTFMLFSGEDTDNEHSEEITKKSTNDPNVVTTKMLAGSIQAAGKTNQEYIEWYNEKYKKDVDDIKFISQDVKQKIYHKLQKGESK